MSKQEGMKPVGGDGELVLYADEALEEGRLYNKITRKWSEPQPLQIFFKWGNFGEITP